MRFLSPNDPELLFQDEQLTTVGYICSVYNACSFLLAVILLSAHLLVR
jgi:hypothetical protein